MYTLMNGTNYFTPELQFQISLSIARLLVRLRVCLLLGFSKERFQSDNLSRASRSNESNPYKNFNGRRIFYNEVFPRFIEKIPALIF